MRIKLPPKDIWYFVQGQRQYGPVPFKSIKEMTSTGDLLPEDLVWRSGMEDWVRADEITGLFSKLPVMSLN